jgi:hypothetical protein
MFDQYIRLTFRLSLESSPVLFTTQPALDLSSSRPLSSTVLQTCYTHIYTDFTTLTMSSSTTWTEFPLSTSLQTINPALLWIPSPPPDYDSSTFTPTSKRKATPYYPEHDDQSQTKRRKASTLSLPYYGDTTRASFVSPDFTPPPPPPRISPHTYGDTTRASFVSPDYTPAPTHTDDDASEHQSRDPRFSSLVPAPEPVPEITEADLEKAT